MHADVSSHSILAFPVVAYFPTVLQWMPRNTQVSRLPNANVNVA